jgi:hypothetical protein
MNKKVELMRVRLEQRVKNLRVWAGCVCVLIACTLAVRANYAGVNVKYADVVAGLIIGVLLGFDLIMVNYINKYSKALKDENKLERLFL